MIPDAFADCLGGLLSVVGQNIDVSFEATNGVTIKKLKTKFKVTEKTAGQSYTVTVGDIQSEEEKDLLCEISVPKTESDVAGKLQDPDSDSPQICFFFTLSWYLLGIPIYSSRNR